MGGGVGDSISSSYDANYSSKFGTGSLNSSSGYGFGFGTGEGATTFNTYAVGGGYNNSHYEPTYSSSGLNGYSNTLIKYDNNEKKNSEYSGPKIEGKYADAFSKLIGGSFSNSSGTN